MLGTTIFAFLFLIWRIGSFETDPFIYETLDIQGNKTSGSKLFKIKEYEAHLEGVGPDDSYWEWLAFRNQGFLSKLVSCPFCLGFWLNVLTCY